ncbi:MAG: hypothetical protein QOF05_288 [Sphingomonadales bacterium]|nr:hypothetical protein [Sphingomonadales bacterium]
MTRVGALPYVTRKSFGVDALADLEAAFDAQAGSMTPDKSAQIAMRRS